MNEDFEWIFGVLIITVIFFGYKYFVLTAQVKDYRTALEMANGNIDTANDNIDSANEAINQAQSDEWSDYDTMGSDIDNLQTVDSIDSVDDPHPKK